MQLLITGGAGFIGSNAADYFLSKGHAVTLFDNLNRPKTELNLQWIQERHPQVQFILGDIRDAQAVDQAVQGVDAILHLAGQVAVTTSIQNPLDDFEINARGTLNILEAMRRLNPNAVLINASTNKVYGGMGGILFTEGDERYQYADYPFGIPESFGLDFHSPYGCSKGAADQYVLDYARIYGLKTVSLRQSCIYGPRQFGVEDQGWVAHFVIAAVHNRPISIFGDGKQVRDILHVHDLVRLYELAIDQIHSIQGEALNIGGGPESTISIWQEFGPILAELTGREIPVTFKDWRPGDQRVFIADIRKADRLLNWRPEIDVLDGITTLYNWVAENPSQFI